MPSAPSPSSVVATSTENCRGADEGAVSHGTGAGSSSSSSSSSSETEKKGGSSNDDSFALVDAMAAADRIRQAYLRRNDPKETGRTVPPGTWQGAAAFAATGLLMTPFRRSILAMTGTTKGPFRGFVDLLVTPVLAVGAAQVGLVIGTLHGSSYYLDRLAVDAATTTTKTRFSSSSSSSGIGSDDLISVRIDKDDRISYSSTTETLDAARESAVADLCRELLSSASSPPPRPITPPSFESQSRSPPFQKNSADPQTETPSFASWDPRSKTMKSLLDAVDSCRRRDH